MARELIHILASTWCLCADLSSVLELECSAVTLPTQHILVQASTFQLLALTALRPTFLALEELIVRPERLGLGSLASLQTSLEDSLASSPLGSLAKNCSRQLKAGLSAWTQTLSSLHKHHFFRVTKFFRFQFTTFYFVIFHSKPAGLFDLGQRQLITDHGVIGKFEKSLYLTQNRREPIVID